MTRPAPRDADRDTRGILLLLALGLALRLMIAYLLPGSGFKVDIDSFAYWSSNLASQGPVGFYDRPFFHDYTPGYLYVLWLFGIIGGLIGQPLSVLGTTLSQVDLLKLPAILADLAIAYLAWSMSRELGTSERTARLAAFLVIVNPVTWFDSVLWGQVDSVGVVPLLLALRELWRDRPERAAVLAMVAALIKPQLGILIPIVAIVVIRRALWPDGGYGRESEGTVHAAGGTDWERRVKGPIRILTTAGAGLLTAIVVSLPFGLSLPGLIVQIFKTAAGYPVASVNAYNPWALATLDGHGVAADRAWICDSIVRPSAASEVRIGDWLLWSSPATTSNCPSAFMIGPFPAVLVGMALFLVFAAIVLWLVARRPDRLTMLIGLTALAVAFFVLPTRVHERYLFPFVGIAAILAAASLRWRVAYVVASAAMLANMYAVLVTLYPDNPGISDWLGIGEGVTSYTGIATAAGAVVLVLAFAVLQLRDRPLDELQADIAADGDAWRDEPDRWPRGEAQPPLGAGTRGAAAAGSAVGGWAAASDSASASGTAPGGLAPSAAGVAPLSVASRSGDVEAGTESGGALVPVWEDRDTSAAGPWAWVLARFRDRPIRADRTAELAGEHGGRFDRLDLWIVAVLVVTLSVARVWRLSEPYEMHFDEVYHPRTATEFLQLWRYGMSHDIYEWTHPHLAKYAMAVGLIALGDDKVTATADLGLPGLSGAVVEPRWDDAGIHARSGDRLWLVANDTVEAYDLVTRDRIATWHIPGATAISVDTSGHRIFVGGSDGAISTIDTLGLDALRATDAAAETAPAGGRAREPTIEAQAWATVGAAIDLLHATSDGTAVEVVAGDPSAASLITLDAASTSETARVDVSDVKAIADHGSNSVAVGDSKGVEFVNTTTGKNVATVRLDGPVGGLTNTSGLNDDPIYASYLAADGPTMVSIKGGTTTGDAQITATFKLPGDAVGPVAFDNASRMIHAVGTSPGTVDRGTGSRSTVYVIEPHANAVYADAALPFDPAAIAMDDNQQYPSSDRQALLAFSSDGAMATVPIGDHAWAWRLPGVIAGVLMGALIYLLARLLFRRREVAVAAAVLVAADGMLFIQSRIGMNDSYVGLGIVGAYVLFAWLWLKPGGTKRHWIAWAVGMPILGVTLGLALASKWVAAYAIGGLGILILARSALGRLILVLGLIAATGFLGYIAISVPEGKAGGNYIFLAIMIALTVAAVVVSVLHPIAWTWEEQRLAIWGPPVIGGIVLLGALATGNLDRVFTLSSISISPLEIGFAGLALGAVMYSAFVVAGRYGFGPMAAARAADHPLAVLEGPAPAPVGWLNLGSGFGIPAFWTLACLTVLPVVIYVISYIPWAFVGGDQLLPGWPSGHTGQTLVELTQSMYGYHNNLTSPHPATSPWWAWPFDLKPVWFYQEGFAGNTSASIYDAGNLIAWWLAIPAMGFVAYQAYKRRSIALGLLTVAFATQWLAWARIDRAAFQYHYYTALPFLLLALAYLIAELWHGPSWRTWVLVRLAAAAAVLGPFAFWLLHRPLCAIAQVTTINPGSQACPTTIPDVALSPRAVGIAVVVGIGVLLLLRQLLSTGGSGDEEESWPNGAGRGGRRLRDRLVRAAAIAVAIVVGFTLITWLVPPTAAIKLRAVPVEPIALIVTIALLPVAAFVATARDSRRFAVGMLIAIGLWFVIWYPNISALPLPSTLTNVYQGLLPTYLYPFQFWVNTTPRASGPFDWKWIGLLGGLTAALAVAFFYSAWSWRLALAERRREELGYPPEAPEPLEP